MVAGVAVVARQGETSTRSRRPILAGVAVVSVVPMVARQGETYNLLGDLWLRGCGGCKEQRDLYGYWETYGCRGCDGCQE